MYKMLHVMVVKSRFLKQPYFLTHFKQHHSELSTAYNTFRMFIVLATVAMLHHIGVKYRSTCLAKDYQSLLPTGDKRTKREAKMQPDSEMHYLKLTNSAYTINYQQKKLG